ncbi:MAG: protein-disulfide reductase DsbD domain-containing protein [Steroidobacteraceae bacterium]|jgi:thiol:disulfide interchange protein DsbD
MRTLKPWIYGLLLAAPAALAQAAFALSGGTIATDNVKARLVSEVRSVAPGQTFFVALELDIREGWHTYWRNPGDSGQATKLVWTLPPGFAAGEIQWTTPHRFELPPLVNYGYAKHAVHLVQITAPSDIAAGGHADLHAKASWLVCSDVCIPESADLSLSLPTSPQAGAIDTASAGLFTAARAELPIAAPASTARVENGLLIIALGADWGATLAQIKDLSFFPYDDGAIEYGAQQTLTRKPNELDLAIKLGYQLPAGPIRGLLLATEQSGSEAIAVPLQIAAALPAGAAAAAAAAAGPEFTRVPIGAAASSAAGTSGPAAGPGFGLLLLFAVLGGLVLNLMPCVFPVLSIKALGLVEQAKKHPAAVRTKGLVFAAGVISSMLALAAVLLALRAGGEQIGWGFQLQSPLFVTLMAYLLFGVGLNLSGVFEVGGGLAGIGDSLTQGDTYHASFFTGVLTTLVATPCTAPFMAAAVGAALTQSPIVALCIFTALGFGLSLPYLSLSFAPWLRRALPKPGAWMDTLKQVFAFPMYGSAAWLIWVLAQQQTAVLGLGAALAGSILIGLAAWAYQKSKSSGSIGRVAALATAMIALIIAVLLPVQLARAPLIGAAAAAATSQPGAALDSEGWQAYDAARVEALKAAGKPLLVNFTASWCLTCLVNERNAFGDSEVQAVFHDKGVTLMKGDWTNRDPAITKALSEFGRAGVPLYLVYNGKPGSPEPQVLPQLLSASVVRAAFAALPNRALQ